MEWDYAERINQRAWKDMNGGGNGVDDLRGFGIIRKSALYAGHAPATVKLFWEIWKKN
jgi:hypothetical protein